MKSAVWFAAVASAFLGVQASAQNPYTNLMTKAAAHARSHGDRFVPALSPEYRTVLSGAVDVAALQQKGIKVVVWTVDDAASMHKLIAMRVDGIISDDPEMLMQALAEEKAAHKGDASWAGYFAKFDAQAHRGGRADRPENTLPSFENGLDNGVTTLETDTGVTTDGVSLIWHDPFLNPHSCRKADGSPYTLDNRVWVHDLSMAEAAKTFICDKTPYAEKQSEFNYSGKQRNDLSLSPVAVAFAKKEGMASPYSPTNAAQLMRFVKFYTAYYATGKGKGAPEAKTRARTGATVKLNLETKLIPPEQSKHLNASPEEFVKALGGAVTQERMEARSFIQSFYFPTLLGFQAKYPGLPTFYLTESVKLLEAQSVPAELK